MNQHCPLIWILKDDRAGNYAQQRGIAEALVAQQGGGEIAEKAVAFNVLSRLPFGACLAACGVRDKARLLPADGQRWPDVILSAGRRHVPVALWLKRQAANFGKKTVIAHSMWPGKDHPQLDLIITPAHDGIATRKKGALCVTSGAPHGLTPEKLRAAEMQWRGKFAALPRPHCVMLVGGKTRKTDISRADVAELAVAAWHLAGDGGSVLVSTSRRTSKAAQGRLEMYEKRLKEKPFLLFHPDQGGGNPYPALLETADILLVTGDSIAMLSEAASLGKKLVVLSHDKLAPKKHRRFHQALAEGQHALLWDGKDTAEMLARLENFQPIALENPAAQAAEAIWRLFVA